ncbi:MAG: GspH/FimT family pseudopilin [Alcanivoracaceae bacterium]|jgi:type IV fimbrial biogenesis protein FimT|nr:GspH/FimT family pseudopilin [Alcanivoracaceae bacterium]
MKGITLIELICVLAIISISTLIAAPAFDRLIQEQRVVQATNRIIGLMHLGRSEALSSGEVMLCDARQDCMAFDHTDVLTLFHTDGAQNPQKLLTHLQLPEGVSVRWRRFRGHALIFRHDGRAHYQNGHFFVCNSHVARKIIMSWSSHARIEKAQPDQECGRI